MATSPAFLAVGTAGWRLRLTFGSNWTLVRILAAEDEFETSHRRSRWRGVVGPARDAERTAPPQFTDIAIC